MPGPCQPPTSFITSPYSLTLVVRGLSNYPRATRNSAAKSSSGPVSYLQTSFQILSRLRPSFCGRLAVMSYPRRSGKASSLQESPPICRQSFICLTRHRQKSQADITSAPFMRRSLIETPDESTQETFCILAVQYLQKRSVSLSRTRALFLIRHRPKGSLCNKLRIIAGAGTVRVCSANADPQPSSASDTFFQIDTWLSLMLDGYKHRSAPCRCQVALRCRMAVSSWPAIQNVLHEAGRQFSGTLAIAIHVWDAFVAISKILIPQYYHQGSDTSPLLARMERGSGISPLRPFLQTALWSPQLVRLRHRNLHPCHWHALGQQRHRLVW